MILVETTVKMSFHFFLVKRAELTHRARKHHPEREEEGSVNLNAIAIQKKVRDEK